MTEFTTKLVAGEGRRALEVDVFAPAQANGVAVILLHGGGWAQGHRASMHGYARALSALGFTCLAAEYRLLGEAPWPAQIEDVRDVVRWAKANAGELGIDPGKVALQGYSAGAHLALLVAGTQPGSGHENAIGNPSDGTEVASVVAFFPPPRLDANPAAFDRPPYAQLLNGGGMEAARAASPIYYINPAFPSTFLLGGMGDYMQPLASGLSLLEAFEAAGSEVEFHYFHSQRHEFPSTPGMLDGVMAEVAFYYRRTLLDRAALEDEARALNPFARATNMQEFAQMMQAGPPR